MKDLEFSRYVREHYGWKKPVTLHHRWRPPMDPEVRRFLGRGMGANLEPKSSNKEA